MSKLPFIELLNQNKPIIADGAMGTMLHQRGVGFDVCFDLLNNFGDPQR